MKLVELEPQFLRISNRKAQGQTFVELPSIEKATGIMFLCPKCFRRNKGPVGTHSIICWTPAVKPGVIPGPGRWAMTGAGVDDLTLSPSVHLLAGCGWHGYVRDGEVSDA